MKTIKMGGGQSKANDLNGQAVSNVVVNNDSVAVHNEEMNQMLKVLVIIAIINLSLRLRRCTIKLTKNLTGPLHLTSGIVRDNPSVKRRLNKMKAKSVVYQFPAWKRKTHKMTTRYQEKMQKKYLVLYMRLINENSKATKEIHESI